MSLAYSEQVWIWQWHGHDWYWWYMHCVATRPCQGWNQAVGLLSSKVRHKYWCNFFALRVYRIIVSSRAIRTANTHAPELLHKEKRRSQNCRSSTLHADHSAIPRLSGDMIQNNHFSDIALYNFLVCDNMNVHSSLQDASCKQGQSIRRCELAQVLYLLGPTMSQSGNDECNQTYENLQAAGILGLWGTRSWVGKSGKKRAMEQWQIPVSDRHMPSPSLDAKVKS